MELEEKRKEEEEKEKQRKQVFCYHRYWGCNLCYLLGFLPYLRSFCIKQCKHFFPEMMETN